jgi:hypothetical protein
MGDIEGTLGSGLASSGGGVAFDPEEIEAGPGVPTGDQKPTSTMSRKAVGGQNTASPRKRSKQYWMPSVHR